MAHADARGLFAALAALGALPGCSGTGRPAGDAMPVVAVAPSSSNAQEPLAIPDSRPPPIEPSSAPTDPSTEAGPSSNAKMGPLTSSSPNEDRPATPRTPTKLNLAPCSIAREADWPFRPDELRKSPPFRDPAELAERMKEYWRVDAPTWASKVKATKYASLPSQVHLDAEQFVRVPVLPGQTLIVDVSFKDAPTRFDMLQFGKGNPIGDVDERWVSEPGAHVVRSFPLPHHEGVTELLIWPPEGSVVVSLWSVPKGTFPCALMTGEEPLWIARRNCGPQETFESQSKIDSKEGALSSFGDARVQHYFQLSETDWDHDELARRIRVRKLGKRTLYEWTFGRPGCSRWFRVTSDGWMSLYGCCGI